jgi:hypothetical protein
MSNAHKFFDPGDVLRGELGQQRDSQNRPTRLVKGSLLWVVLEASQFEARAHNDSWQDRHYTIGRLRADSHGVAERVWLSSHDAITAGVDVIARGGFSVKPRTDYELIPMSEPSATPVTPDAPVELELNAGVPYASGGKVPADHFVTNITVNTTDARRLLGHVKLTADQVLALLQPRGPITVILEPGL